MTESREADELRALSEMAMSGRAIGAKDMEHLDNPAAAFNYIRIANLIEDYADSGRVHPPILDWGCGYGQVSWLLRQRGIPVVSCDVEERPARAAIEALRKIRIEYLQDPIQLPYESGSFEAVLSVGVLEHVIDIWASLREVNRVLRPGGLFFVFMLPNKFSWAEFIADCRRNSVHPWKCTFGTIDGIFRSHSFSIEKKWRRNFLPRNLTGLHASLKMAYGKHYRQIEVMDALLANFPLTSFFSGVVELIAQKTGSSTCCSLGAPSRDAT